MSADSPGSSGSPGEGPWSGWANAEIYDAFVHEGSIYRGLNERLVELARIATARRVLDLACGAGATAEACLAVLPATAELVGVDASEPMVALARARITDPRARFEVASAATIERVARGPFDRAVSNAAFWQFPTRRPVLAALGRLLEPGALFAFNVPAERLAGEPSEVHPFQVALARAIERRSGRPFPRTPTTLDPARLERQLREAGFEDVRRERLVLRCRQAELMELMEIPAMLQPMTPTLGETERRTVVDEARGRTDADQPVRVPWVYFVARRAGAAPAG
jgi:ubiquinone/menaquinone biosynthesis C-methylase UbiE